MPPNPLTIKKVCPVCENEFTTNRTKAIYCSGACRVRAYRQRHDVVTKQEHHYSLCQREGCERKIPESTRADTVYCSNACRQKVYNEKNKEKVKKEYAELQFIRRKLHEAAEAEIQSNKIADEFLQELIDNG